MIRGVFIATLCLTLLSGCGDDGPGNQNNNACPEQHEPVGPACAPVFDDCPGPAEIAVLGGGCRPVGVTQCATGFVSDSEGGCDPVLPADPCPSGTMEVIGQTGCQPVGITQCAQGFLSDGQGGCDAVLPADPCPSGTMEVLGETDCQPISDCGTTTWGNITTDATTVFVDASYSGGNSDGSQAAPFLTVAEAFAAAGPGGQIAVAEGLYVERLNVSKPVHLVGRCADLVTIQGTTFLGQDRPPVSINSAGSGTTVQGVTLTGDAVGLEILGAENISVIETRVVDTGLVGVYAARDASATFRRVLVERCSVAGLYLEGARVEVVESAIRENVLDANGMFGRGIHSQCDSSENVCGMLTVTDSVFLRNRDIGIAIMGLDATLASSVVRDTRSDGSRSAGVGVAASCDPNENVCGSVSITHSVIERNRQGGVVMYGVDLDLTATVVRDTEVQERDGLYGVGIEAACDGDTQTCGSLNVTESVIAGNRYTGIAIFGVPTAVTSSVVRDTTPDDHGEFGRGIEAECGVVPGQCGNLTVTESLVERNTEQGLSIVGVDAALNAVVVRDTHSNSNGSGGVGVSSRCDSSGTCGRLTVTGSLLSGNRHYGLMAEGPETTVTASVVRDTMGRQADGLAGTGILTMCHEDTGMCGGLQVIGCVIEGNREAGISAAGPDAEIDSTVVRANQSDANGLFGRGINGQCFSATGPCGTLYITDSLVKENREGGVFAFGVHTVVISTVVRDTVGRESDGKYGRGINAQCEEALAECGSITIMDTLVARSRGTGIAVFSVRTSLDGVTVFDTRPHDNGPWLDQCSAGIGAVCDVGAEDCGSLDVTGCVVRSSYTTGISTEGVPGSVQSTLVESVLANPADDAWGYGVEVAGLEGSSSLEFELRYCRIRDAVLAGVLFVRSAGMVGQSVIRGAVYSVVANVGSPVEIAGDNDLSGTEQDGLFWGNMEPSPAPEPALPELSN
jgi:hypothetical protein